MQVILRSCCSEDGDFWCYSELQALSAEYIWSRGSWRHLRPLTQRPSIFSQGLFSVLVFVFSLFGFVNFEMMKNNGGGGTGTRPRRTWLGIELWLEFATDLCWPTNRFILIILQLFYDFMYLQFNSILNHNLFSVCLMYPLFIF